MSQWASESVSGHVQAAGRPSGQREGLCFPEWPDQSHRRPGGETPAGMCTSEGRRPWRSGRASHVILERGTFRGGGVTQPDRRQRGKAPAPGPPSAHLCPRGLSQWLPLGPDLPASTREECQWEECTSASISVPLMGCQLPHREGVRPHVSGTLGLVDSGPWTRRQRCI